MLGVRGSTAAPGADFVRHGGHTSCLAITPDEAARPTLVLDAGTGLRSLTGLLEGAPFHGSIVLSHLHWDHVQGLPFFAPATVRTPGSTCTSRPRTGGRAVTCWHSPSPRRRSRSLPKGLRGAWTFHAMADGTARGRGPHGDRRRDRAQGRTHLRPPGGRRRRLVGVPARPRTGCRDLPTSWWRCWRASTCSSTTPSSWTGSGRSPWTTGMPRCRTRSRWRRSAGAGQLVLFHHSPARSDDALDEIASWAPDLAGDLPVVVAREGMVLDVIARRPG